MRNKFPKILSENKFIALRIARYIFQHFKIFLSIVSTYHLRNWYILKISEYIIT